MVRIHPDPPTDTRPGSNITPTRGAIAQLGERLLCKQEVTGSIPVGSTVGKCCKYLAFSPMGIRATTVPVAGRGA